MISDETEIMQIHLILDIKFERDLYFLLTWKFAKVLDGPSLKHSHPTPSKVFLQEKNLRSKFFLSFCKISRNISSVSVNLFLESILLTLKRC